MLTDDSRDDEASFADVAENWEKTNFVDYEFTCTELSFE